MIDQRSNWAGETKSFTTARKRIVKLVELQSLMAKCCKIRKIYSPAKFANFVYICITRGKSYHFELKLPRKWLLNIYKICKLRSGPCDHIFRILHNISPPNFAILLIFRFFFQM